MNNIKPAVINTIKGVFFDYGGVIEEVEYRDNFFNKGMGILRNELELLNIKIPEEELRESLIKGIKEYSNWYKENNFKELPNEEIWVKFLLPEICSTNKDAEIKIREKSEKLSSIFEYYLYFRRPAKNIFEIFKTIFNMGYTIALVSNTMSRTLIPERLEKLNIKRFFSSIVLSSETGIRKPNRAIFDIALSETGLLASQCIYIGDTLSRDIEGSKNAGFKKSILIPSKITEEKDKDYTGNAKPDLVISTLKEILKLI